MQELTYALRFLDTRHLDHDLAELALAFKGLDVGLGYAETVDTCAKHFVRVAHGSFHLVSQYALHVGVGAVGRDALTAEAGGEDAAQVIHTAKLLIVLDEKLDDVARTLVGLLLRLGQSFLERRVGRVLASQRLDHVGYRHLEDDVHSSLKVKAKADLEFLTAFQGVDAEPYALVLHRIEVGLSGRSHLTCLFLVVMRHCGERQVEKADQRQGDCDYLYKSFVLHCLFLCLCLICFSCI